MAAKSPRKIDSRRRIGGIEESLALIGDAVGSMEVDERRAVLAGLSRIELTAGALADQIADIDSA